ncbi:MAG: acyltransferase [Coriobacteriia bacterium]|nr:acyltransferase [Coriobacteriia bacterium]
MTSEVQQSVDAPAPAGKPRNATIDGLKYLAAAGIVLHHVAANPGGRIATFLMVAPLWSLFFFFAVSGYFHGETGGRGGRWLLRRITRLGVPYALWSLILVAWSQREVLQGAPFALPEITNVVFLAGAHGILWSLPMLIYFAIAVEILARNALMRRLLLGLCIALTVALYWSPLWETVATHPLANFLLAPRWLVAYLAGMEVRASRLRPAPRSLLWLAPAAMVAVGLLRLGSSLLDPRVHTTLETTLWIGTALAILWGARNGLAWFGVDRLAWGRDYLIGVYVTHILWLQFFFAIVPSWKVTSIVWVPLMWAAVLGAATLTVWLLRSNRVTRVMVA